MQGRQSFGRVIAARAESDPDQVVVISEHEGRRLTAAELDAASNRVAREYLAHGVSRDDLVTVALPNSIEFIVACVAIWKIGATPNPSGPGIGSHERRHLETLARPALVVGSTPDDPSIPWLPSGHHSALPADPLPDSWARSWKAPTSSGSTGRPKIVLATAPALIDPDRQVAPFLPHQATQLVTAPLWHSAQFTYAFRGLLTGHRLILTDTFDEHRFCALIDRYAVTWTLLSPSAIHLLIRLQPSSPIESLESLLHLGAPCAPADKRALIDWLGPERVVEVYAGSESNGLTMITGPEWLQHPGSVGKPIGGTEVRILDPAGRSLPTGETGHIWMRRGTEPTYRYLGGQSRRTYDGWDSLGDLGYVDDDGYLTVVERASDVIDIAGTPVYPSRVEHALTEHPAVREAVVTGDAHSGLTATVDIGAADVESAALVEFSRARLSAAEVPAVVHIRRSRLRNQAGKVRRGAFLPPAAPVTQESHMSVSTRVDLALLGFRGRPPVSRSAGAGPSADGHLVIDGLNAAIPRNPDSPFVFDGSRVLLDGQDTGLDVEVIDRPRFYDLRTADGVPYEKIARLHGRNVLATTVVQTCIRYAPDQRCRFCTIEESLRSGATTAVKRPAELAEVAEAAVRLDGVTQMVMTTGTSAGTDRGARHLARCVTAVKTAVPDLPIQVQCEPPADLEVITELRESGADAIGIHIESLDDEVRRRWMPGKATVPVEQYRRAWREAVRVFGRNQVSTYLLVGLGENPDELIAGAAELIEMGVYPFVVPFRPQPGSLAVDVDEAPAPDAAIVEKVSREVAALLTLAGMAGADQRAGCAACGACSVLQGLGA